MSELPISAPTTPDAKPPAQVADLPLPKLRRWLKWLIAAQVLFVLGVAIAGYATEALGRTISLRTTPIDPRDLLYGDYVRLNYSISQLPGHLWQGKQLPRRQQAAYVLLEPRNGVFEAVGVYPEKPEAKPDQAILRGSVQDVWRRGIRLRYGLERYYVPENMGRQLEQRQSLRVQVSIAPWGQARITQVDVAP